MKFIKFGFYELTSQRREYYKYEDPNIVEYLIDAQDCINYGEFPQGYERELLAMKERHRWTVEFVKEWIAKSVQMKENNSQLFKAKKEAKQSKRKASVQKTLKRASPTTTKHS